MALRLPPLRSLSRAVFLAGPATTNPALREAAHGKSGVYLLFAPGKTRPHYVGHSGADRLWHTLRRHFYACRSFREAHGRPPKPGERTKSPENFCHAKAKGWTVAIILSPPRVARALEARAIRKYKPRWNRRFETSHLPEAPF
jgi:hypothetical protein